MNRTVIVALIFASGLGLGWYAGFQHGRVDQSRAAADSPVPRVRPDRPGREPRAASATGQQRLAAKVREMETMSSTEMEQFVDEIDIADIGPVLVRLMTQLGPDGLDWSKMGAVKKMLTRWASEDFDGAMAWVDTCPNEGLARWSKGSLLNALAESDPDRALELHLSAKAENDQFRSSVVNRVMAKKAEEGAEALVDVLGKLPLGSGTSGIGLNYPEGFEFAVLLDGMLPYYREGAAGRPSDLPSDVLETWAKSDPESAHQWWIRNGKIGFEGWGDIMKPLENSMGAEDAGEWAAAKWTAADPKLRKQMAEEINGWMGTPEPSRVNAILGGMPDAATAQEFIREVIVAHGLGFSNQPNLAPLLSKIPTREMRLEILREAARTHRINAEPLSDAMLESWQITRDEMKALHD